MVQVKFRYKDKYTRGEWSYQECIVESVDECIAIYGLNIDCDEYEILEVTEL